jgi:lipid II:glycine glycyltransferase (peptidoglycan interpeptide bridge formation enzyme)
MVFDLSLYKTFSETEPTLPIFMQIGWLDAVCGKNTEGGKNWSAALATDKNGQIDAAIVFQIRKKWGITTLSEPPLTPFCGVWLRQKSFSKTYEAQTYVKKTLEQLIEQLPKAHRYHFRFHYNLTDWQPFYWAGWQQMTRYTYVLGLSEKDFFQNYSTNTQRNIRKANAQFTYSTGSDFSKFLKINNLTYQRQQLNAAFFNDCWKNCEKFLVETQSRSLFFAQNIERNEIPNAFGTEGGYDAAMYVIWDKNNRTAYYMGGGATEKGRENGAMHGLMHYILIEAQKLGIEKFDFEGSMLKGVENFFRGFGGDLMPYHQVWKKPFWL